MKSNKMSKTCQNFDFWMVIVSGGGRVVKLLACGARGPGFDSLLATWTSEIAY